MFKKLLSFFKKKDIDEDYYDDYFYDESSVEKFPGVNLDNTDEKIDEMSMPIRKKIDFEDKEDRLTFIRDCCDQVINAGKNLEDVKQEYGAVTQYILDMQKFSSLPENKRNDIIAIAKNIDRITKDKEQRINGRKNVLSQKQIAIIEPNEDIMPDEIKKLKEYEDYKRVIEDDMRKLEGERGAINFERKSLVKWQDFLKFIMTIVLTFIVIFTCLFICIYKVTNKDMTIPFLCMIAIAAVAAVYAGVEGANNRKKNKISASKMNRLVELMNKTKIKYANNKSVIDYMYAKYGVKNSMQLKYVWEQYISQKEADKAYRRNIVLLDNYSNSMVNELEQAGISDTQIWLYQTDALIAPDKMQEIETRLEDRRNKLRKRIDYNNKLIEMGMADIKSVIKKNSDYKIEVIAVLKRYGITLD